MKRNRTDAALAELWKEQDEARRALMAVLGPIAARMSPPRQHPADRWPWLRPWLTVSSGTYAQMLTYKLHWPA
jgi:hypothetical protein